MPRTTVSILKFVGTVSLGLLTGVSYTASTQSIPALLVLPSSSQAQATFTSHKQLTKNHLYRLFALSVTSYGVAFALSPRHLRHPYLLWSSLVAFIGFETAEYLWRRAGGDSALGIDISGSSAAGSPSRKSGREDEDGYIDASGGSSVRFGESGFGLHDDAFGDDSVVLNGEEVRKGMEKWRVIERVRASITGVAFLMGVVGIWGDGLGTSVANVGIA